MRPSDFSDFIGHRIMRPRGKTIYTVIEFYRSPYDYYGPAVRIRRDDGYITHCSFGAFLRMIDLDFFTTSWP